MRILHIGKFYAPIEGGIESITRFVVESLKGHSSRVFSFNNCNRSCEDDVDEIPVIRCSSWGILASQPLSLIYYFHLRRIVRMFHPDVIHFHYPNPLGALYMLLVIGKHRKLVVHWHSYVVAQRLLRHFVKPIEIRLLRRADAIIATSPNYVEASPFLSRFRNKTTIIPNSINEQELDLKPGEEAEVERIRAKYGGKPIVFFLGRHVEYKGLEYLLEAERLISRDCVFLIAGQGPLTGRLKSQFHSNRLHWLGRVSEAEKRLYYHAASIFAFPSITRNEAFGVVLAEAMYCQCPAVTFSINGSGVNWVSLDDETGIEVKERNPQAYAQAIDRLLGDDSLRQELGRRAKKRVCAFFSAETVSNQYRKLYTILN